MTGHGNDASNEQRPIGDVLDGLGITGAISDGELVAGAVVLLKVLQADGRIRLSMVHSEGLGWIERAGMLRVAEVIETGSAQSAADHG
jgi:hypothetical protein